MSESFRTPFVPAVSYDGEMTHDDSSHGYAVRCQWSGSTIIGYEHYIRTHVGSAPPATQQVELSSDATFRGDPSLLNPEQLVVLAASSCQLLSFLAVAARARVDVLDYDDEALGVMPAKDLPMRITSISLRPNIRVAAGTSVDQGKHLVELAHRECYVANSLRTEISITPTISVDASSSAESR